MTKLLLVAVLLLPTPAAAHAILLASTPAPAARVSPGTFSLALRYNSRIDRTRSRLTLTRPDHTQSVLPIAPAGPADTLATTATLSPGAYSLRWQVLAIDGHITRGDLPFTVTP